MSFQEIITAISRWLKRQSGSAIEYDLEKYKEVLEKILELKDSIKSKNDAELKAFSNDLRTRSRAGENPDNMLVEAFACVYESVRRVLHLEPFDVQIIGAIVLHQGKIAEMQTGEGKTLAAVFPAYLNALSGKGVHLLTFNDYLADRDSRWMGPVYEFLGLSVGHVREGMTIAERQTAYKCDITYLTAKESGFDYLRDGLCMDSGDIVHRDFNYAIIDEADSILIDEARIPLVIAGEVEAATEKTGTMTVDRQMATLVHGFARDRDFESDAYARNVFLTEKGLKKTEEALMCGNLYDAENFELLSCLHFALHAKFLLFKDKDYIVRNGRVELVDECTGRVAKQRKWPQGLQRAVEAKEGIAQEGKGKILNSITLQHFMLLYPKRAGMTATAQPAEEEFRAFYGLPITVIPPAKKCIRKDYGDIIFRTKKEKYESVVREIAEAHAINRPVLVGTQSVAESVMLAALIRSNGIECKVLNAMDDLRREAEIVADAGRPGAVTISTNMAGRGTDIRLGGEDCREKDLVAGLGGLYVIATNRHESKRIDNQLRGRAARQGDPGASRFFISIEDDLFQKYRLKDLIPARFFQNGIKTAFDHPIITKEIDRVQRIIEGQDCEIKKTLCRYSILVEQQRNITRMRRTDMLREGTSRFFESRAPEGFIRLKSLCGEKSLDRLCLRIYLSQIDNHWSDYCCEINDLRDGIHLRRWGKQDPLFEFQKIIIKTFETFFDRIEEDALAEFNRIAAGANDASSIRAECEKAPGATWTYLVNDDPLADKFALAFANDIGFSAWAGLLWPLTALYFFMTRTKPSSRRGQT